jgi:hypothetical protein
MGDGKEGWGWGGEVGGGGREGKMGGGGGGKGWDHVGK